MLDHRNSEVWAAYGLPEDPCFMDKEGLCLLRTVVHEEICEYYGEVLENADFFEEARQDDFHRPKLDFEGSRERVVLKKAEIEREQQAQENTVKEIAPALRNAGFCISENHFFRIAENQIFIFGMVQGEEIHYDAIPMFGDYSNRLRIFPDFSTVLHKEEKELYDTSDKNLFLEFILPKLAAVNDLESLYVLRADFCQSHFGETIEDDTLAPYILMKLGQYQEAAAQIRTLYESHMSAILDFESRAAAFLDEEEYDETKNWLQKEFSCLLSLANYAESGDYAAVNRLLEETQEKTLEHIRRDIAEIPFRA